MHHEQILTLKFSTLPQYTRKIFDIIDELLDIAIINQEKRKEFIIALGEALDNAINHGNKLDKNKCLDVECLVCSDKITCRIRDEGNGFDHKALMEQPVSEFNPQALIKKAALGKLGGLGIALIRKCSDELSYNELGNEISISKALK